MFALNETFYGSALGDIMATCPLIMVKIKAIVDIQKNISGSFCKLMISSFSPFWRDVC